MSIQSESSRYPRDLSRYLTVALGEKFVKIGNIPIYKSESKTVIARWSKKHDKNIRAIPYWFGLKVPDITRINEYGITHFVFVCDDEGLILLPTEIIQGRIYNNELLESLKNGLLLHYHIQFDVENGQMMWILKTGIRQNVKKYYYKFLKTSTIIR